MLNCNEIWKDIPEYEDLYEVSNLGRVRSIERNVVSSFSRIRRVNEKVIVGKPTKTSPYLRSILYKNNVGVGYGIHRLVATCFCIKPNSVDTLEVNHIDGNVLNNCANNLEWITRSQNLKHKFILHPEYVDQHASRMLGTKYSSVSKYHNVSWDSNRSKWIAGIKEKGKPLFQKRFNCEHEAAKFVNQMIDHFGLTNRPKNIIT